MNYFKILTFVVCIAFFTTHGLYAQTNSIENKSFAKTTTKQLPQKVKDAALAHRGYQIKDVFIGAEKSNAKIYKVVLVKGKRSFTVLVDRRGKIVKTLE